MKPPNNIYLRPLYEDILRYIGSLQDISFTHVYKERNTTAGTLSKMGVLIYANKWRIWTSMNGIEDVSVVADIPQ